MQTAFACLCACAEVRINLFFFFVSLLTLVLGFGEVLQAGSRDDHGNYFRQEEVLAKGVFVRGSDLLGTGRLLSQEKLGSEQEARGTQPAVGVLSLHGQLSL